MHAHARFAALAVFLAACSGSTAPKTLSDADAQEMYAALSSVAATVGLDGTAPGGTVALAAFNQSAPCPAGGSVTATGNTNTVGGVTTSTLTGTYSACKATAPGASRTWTMDGSVTLQATEQSTGALSATLKGSINASTTGVSATCAIDVSISVTAGGQSTITGSVCGRTGNFSG